MFEIGQGFLWIILFKSMKLSNNLTVSSIGDNEVWIIPL